MGTGVINFFKERDCIVHGEYVYYVDNHTYLIEGQMPMQVTNPEVSKWLTADRPALAGNRQTNTELRFGDSHAFCQFDL